MKNRCSIIELESLNWHSVPPIASRRFRLFVAADVTSVSTEILSEFAHSALKSGMVYFSAWGPGCGRFHDVVDEVLVEDSLDSRLFVAANEHDKVMTSWHEHESLEEALDFFVKWATPDGAFEQDSDYWLTLSLGEPTWTKLMRKELEASR